MINKIKHIWYTYIKKESNKSPFYYKRSEVSKRVLKAIGIKPNKTYILENGLYFATAVDSVSGDVVFVMSSGEHMPNDIERSYMVDARNFLHIQNDGKGYRQHLWFVQYKYFHEEGENLAKFDAKMLLDIIDELTAIVNEVK